MILFERNTNNIPVFKEITICFFLVLSMVLIYWQVNNFDYIKFDDSMYVTGNKHIVNGLSLDNIIWAFKIGGEDKNYWHPLTWISHMIDIQMYGLNPGMHHRTNLLFHIFNTLLVFHVFRKMTGEILKSAFAAFIFAFHPINVESIAWIAERKNVLSTFFWLLTISAYTHYSRKPGFFNYFQVFLFLSMGLMAKPMLITLPIIFLLLDYWPLRRISSWNLFINKNLSFKNRKLPFIYLLIEKIPFIILSCLSVYISFFSLKGSDIVISTEDISMKVRICNALISYIDYIVKMFYPVNLAVFYPFPSEFQLLKTAGYSLVLLIITFLIIFKSRKFPYIITGWFWYIISLIPVSGIKQAGLWPAMADRWAYVPFIGLFVIIAWGGAEIFEKLKLRSHVCFIICLQIIIVLMAITYLQTGYWKNSFTLFKHAADVTEDNYVAHANLGMIYSIRGNIDQAVYHYSESLRLEPYNAKAYNNLGFALAAQGKIKQAIFHYKKALALNPEYARAHNNIGVVMAQQGRMSEAVFYFKKALEINPNYVKAKKNLEKAMSDLRLQEKQMKNQ
ncbi:Tetratricopeptide repeat-containing protein [Desulfonema limicola]|uniref:Tetratricopeptide repeat-containing protein n=1 Tax=Desulfonema limicola TaxID=45656 RepID=A0A975GI29_9BACT|nr:tetratricopeptide repeat protein [Desulfonema limicola]QTA81914.1 Tetratricopeptide repeat-containing protein [Desulfonema limicola]